MAHGSNILHSIKLPNGTTYEIHDNQAIHTLADLAALGMNTDGLFSYQGTVATVADLPATGNKVGYVYHVTENHSEYVWAKVDGGTSEAWEEFGKHLVVNHTHNVTVTGTNAASTVSGSATVTGGNSSSSVSGSASIPNAPKVSASAKYAKVSTGNDTFVKSYPGATSKMVTTSITPAGTAISVVNSVTPTTDSITGVSGSTTASKATAGTAVAVAKAGTAVTLATRASSQTTVGNANVGTATTVATGLRGGSVTAGSKASWSASVTNGVLSFSFTQNTPTAVTLPTATTTSITPATTSTTKIYAVGGTKSIIPAVDNGSIIPYTFADVTVPTAAEEATTFVTGVTTGTTSAATVGTAKTVATGALSSSGTGSSVMTGLGTATTAKALTSASLATGTSDDGVHTGDDVTIETQTLSGTISGTAVAQTWTQNTGTISGTAAAQTWTQKRGSTGNPIAN